MAVAVIGGGPIGGGPIGGAGPAADPDAAILEDARRRAETAGGALPRHVILAGLTALVLNGRWFADALESFALEARSLRSDRTCGPADAAAAADLKEALHRYAAAVEAAADALDLAIERAGPAGELDPADLRAPAEALARLLHPAAEP